MAREEKELVTQMGIHTRLYITFILAAFALLSPHYLQGCGKNGVLEEVGDRCGLRLSRKTFFFWSCKERVCCRAKGKVGVQSSLREMSSVNTFLSFPWELQTPTSGVAPNAVLCIFACRDIPFWFLLSTWTML